MTAQILTTEPLKNLVARVHVDQARPYLCAETCPWLADGPRCCLFGRRWLAWRFSSPNRLPECIGDAFPNDIPDPWPWPGPSSK